MGSRDVLLVSMPFKKKPFEGKVSLAIRQGAFFLFVSLPDWPVIFVIAPIAFAAFRFTNHSHAVCHEIRERAQCSFARLMTNSTHTQLTVFRHRCPCKWHCLSSSFQMAFSHHCPFKWHSLIIVRTKAVRCPFAVKQRISFCPILFQFTERRSISRLGLFIPFSFS